MNEPNPPTVPAAAAPPTASAVLCVHCEQPLAPAGARYAARRDVTCPHCAGVFTVDGSPAATAGSPVAHADPAAESAPTLPPLWSEPSAFTVPAAADAEDADSEEYVYLVGHTPLGDFLDFMSAEAAGDLARDRRALSEWWRAADDYRRARERDARVRHRQQQDRERQRAAADGEWFTHVLRRPAAGADAGHDDADTERAALPAAGTAGPAGVQPLPPELETLADRVMADPICRRAFTAVPVRVGWVELASLVVFQRSINLDHVRRLQRQLGPRPSADNVFRFCLPYDHPVPPHRVRALPGRSGDEGTYVFTSDSNDLRFLEPALLDPCDVTGYEPLGPVAAVLGLAVGFGSNYLNVIASNGRLVLNNGNHRAYALRDLGLTHAPCLVQEVTRREELSVVGAGRFRRHPDYYLKDPCPPLLADYFDPQMAQRVRLVRRAREVRVTFRVEEVSL